MQNKLAEYGLSLDEFKELYGDNYQKVKGSWKKMGLFDLPKNSLYQKVTEAGATSIVTGDLYARETVDGWELGGNLGLRRDLMTGEHPLRKGRKLSELTGENLLDIDGTKMGSLLKQIKQIKKERLQLIGTLEKKTPEPSRGDSSQEDTPPIKLPEPQFVQAALEGQTNKIRDSLQAGSNPNMWNETDRTPLMLAAFNGHTGIVKMLLEAGANIHAKDASGRTALMYAATGSNVETVRLLLENGAQINAVDQGERWSALMFAAAEGYGEVVDVLLQHGADGSLLDADADTAADFAEGNGHVELAERLKKKLSR